MGIRIAFVAIFTLVDFLAAVIQEEDLSTWWKQLSWVKLSLPILIVSLLIYFVVVQRSYHRLIHLKRELHLLLKHPDLEKPVS